AVAPARAGNDDYSRAVASYAAMQRAFMPGGPLYRDPVGSQGYSKAWPYSQALAATVELAGLDPHYRRTLRARLRGLDSYWNRSITGGGYDSGVRAPLGGGGPQYYDDNEWIALEL